MPQTAMKIGARYSLLAFLMISAVIGALGQAADVAGGVAETFSQTAERFGLWAALVLVLVGAALWYAYAQACFVQNTLVELVRQNQRCMDRVCEAIRNAPCHVKITDSDKDAELTPNSKAAGVVAKRQSRAARHEEQRD